MTESRQTAPLRLGIIGLGGIAQIAHLPALGSIERLFEIRHLCDLSPALLAAVSARTPGEPRCSTRAEEVLADPEVDAVLILTPSAHGPETLAALTAGKHVFAEKPLCITVAELNQIEQMAASTGRVVQVGYMKTHEPMVEEARRQFRELDDPRLVRVTVLHPDDSRQQAQHTLLRFDDVPRSQLEPMLHYEREATRAAIGDLPESVSRLYLDLALGSLVHQTSLVRFIVGGPLGPAAEVSAWPFDFDAPYRFPPSLSVDAELYGDVHLRLDWLWVPSYPEYFEEVEIFGVTGSLRLRLPPPYVPGARARLWQKQADGAGRHVRELRASGRHSAFRRELEYFYRAVRDGAPTNFGGVREDLWFLQNMVARLAVANGLSPGGEAAELLAANTKTTPHVRTP
ncbi:MAG: Gfo/Idh/MocA family protein [bacterium]